MEEKNMTTEKMTVHKALAELKVLDDRIITVINDADFCLANKNSNQKLKGIPVEGYKKVMIGFYDKATDLINRREAIKRAVTLSNASTQVKIGEAEYTVAEAIEMKNHGIKLKQLMLSEMRDQYKDAQAKILANNGKELEERAEKYVVGLYGSGERKTAMEEIEKTKKAFIEANQYVLIDPINILDKINALENEISEFTAEVDAALSVSNATTLIEFSY